MVVAVTELLQPDSTAGGAGSSSGSSNGCSSGSGSSSGHGQPAGSVTVVRDLHTFLTCLMIPGSMVLAPVWPPPPPSTWSAPPASTCGRSPHPSPITLHLLLQLLPPCVESVGRLLLHPHHGGPGGGGGRSGSSGLAAVPAAGATATPVDLAQLLCDMLVRSTAAWMTHAWDGQAGGVEAEAGVKACHMRAWGGHSSQGRGAELADRPALDPAPTAAVDPAPATALDPVPALALSHALLPDPTVAGPAPAPASALDPAPATVLDPATATALKPATATALDPATATALDPAIATALDQATATALSPALLSDPTVAVPAPDPATALLPDPTMADPAIDPAPSATAPASALFRHPMLDPGSVLPVPCAMSTESPSAAASPHYCRYSHLQHHTLLLLSCDICKMLQVRAGCAAAMYVQLGHESECVGEGVVLWCGALFFSSAFVAGCTWAYLQLITPGQAWPHIGHSRTHLHPITSGHTRPHEDHPRSDQVTHWSHQVSTSSHLGHI